MDTGVLTSRAAGIARSVSGLSAFMTDSTWARRRSEPGIADFTFGNPHDLPLPGVVDAIRASAAPHATDWYAYKMSEPAAQAAAAASLGDWYDMEFDPADIALTTGAFGALAVALNTVCGPGDEVIFSLPPWFFYEPLVRQVGATPVKAPIDPLTFDLDLVAIESAITPRTRAIIVNTPNNPTGRIYPPQTLRLLASLLASASARNGRPIYVISDEPYNRLVFDGKRPHTPAAYYPHTLIAYSYGKVLLAPGQRLGYLALAPSMPEREQMRQAILLNQMTMGWAFPNAVMQYALPELERQSIDIAALQRKRDRMVGALREMGYLVRVPEATFYLLPRSPRENDIEFADILAGEDVFVLPGSYFDMPGYFRISLTATEEMIERSLPGFAAALEWARAYDLVDAVAADGY